MTIQAEDLEALTRFCESAHDYVDRGQVHIAGRMFDMLEELAKSRGYTLNQVERAALEARGWPKEQIEATPYAD
jgi:regulator of sigma D